MVVLTAQVLTARLGASGARDSRGQSGTGLLACPGIVTRFASSAASESRLS